MTTERAVTTLRTSRQAALAEAARSARALARALRPTRPLPIEGTLVTTERAVTTLRTLRHATLATLVALLLEALPRLAALLGGHALPLLASTLDDLVGASILEATVTASP